MSKLFLCGITTNGNETNLRAMIDPIREHFDGLCFTFHYPKDEGAEYLEAQKGAGEIVYAKWCRRHGYSQTHFLWQGPMQNGDKFVLLDTLERLSPEFCGGDLKKMLKLMDQRNIAVIANYGKGLIFRYNEQLEFKGSPHWYATNLDGQSINVELKKEQFWNVRNEQRDEFQWVGHYAKYFLYPAGSNHALLGLDHHKGKPEEIFPIREGKRLNFLKEMNKAGFPRTLDGLKDFMSQPLTNELKALINSDKVWNDFYHYTVLGDHTLKDNHNPETMKVVE